MYEKLFIFGDSWGFGSELKMPKENPFGYWLSKLLNAELRNNSSPGASLGLIAKLVTEHLSDISARDLVIIVIPPDVRWYDQSERRGFYSMYRMEEKSYLMFLQEKTVEWFEYHHSLFIYVIQKMLEDRDCDYLLTHNYGQLPDFTKYNLIVDGDRFLSKYSLTELLTGKTSDWHTYQLDTDNPPPADFTGPYFEGKICHPNEQGHKQIAQMFLDRIRERYEK